MKLGKEVGLVLLALSCINSVLGQACSSSLSPIYTDSASIDDSFFFSGYRYYYWTSEANKQVRIRVDPWTGIDVELYVSSTVTQPTSANFEFKSTGQDIEGLVIKSTAVKCYAVAVRGLSSVLNSYTLTFEEMAVNASVCALSPSYNSDQSVSANTVLTGNYDYFYVEIPAGKQVRVRADPTVGDVNLFASNAVDRPTASSFQFSSIIQSDIEGIVIPSTSGDCYAIGVFGNALTSLYSVSFEFFDIDYSMCAYSPDYSGDQVSTYFQTVLTGNYDYYYYAAKAGKQITIRTESNFVGNVDLYVSSATALPTESNYQFNSTISQGAGEGLIFVAETDDCYAIGVHGISALSEYALEIEAATPEAGSCPLNPVYNSTASISDIVLSGYYDYYYMEAKAGQVFTITVDPTVGSVDLFISSATLYPTAENFQYNSTNSTDAETITILPSEDACYAIAVRGTSLTTYYTVDISTKKLTSSPGNNRSRAEGSFELNYAAFFATLSALIAISIILVSLVCYGGPVGNAISAFFASIFCCRCLNSCRKDESRRSFHASYPV